jgi:membrane dipeptidase
MDSPRIFVSEETLEFHRSCLVVDLHTDCLITGRVLGRNLGRRHRAPRGFMPWRLHADIPKLIEGGVDAVFLGIVTHPWPRRAFERALRAIDYQRYVLEKNRDLVTLALTPGDILAARREGRLAVLTGVEGMHMLGGCVERIEEFFDLGVRYITMAHFTSNRFARSSADPWAKKPRLGTLGIQAVEMMDRIGMMIDVSHTHSGIIEDVCGRVRKPVIVSHGATCALRPVFRNLSDTDIRNVAGTGGVIGLIYACNWLSSGVKGCDLARVVDHADHIRRLVGVEHVALGSDWDGFIEIPPQMKDAAGLPALTQLFLDRGYTHDETEKILGQNFMRVFEQVCG